MASASEELQIRQARDLEELARAREAVRGLDPVAAVLERAELGPESLFHGHGQVQGFVALRGAELVGRVVASIDRDLIDGNRGHFGYFECVDDVVVARALLSAAEQWLRAQGKTGVHGPVQLSVLRGYRLLVEGYGREPFPGEPRNPPYYVQLLEEAGYRGAAAWHSWEISRLQFWLWRVSLLRHYRALRRLRKQGYRVERAPLEADLEGSLRRLHPVLMECFAEGYGWAPISVREYVQVEQRLRPMLAAVRASYLLSPVGEVVGFTYGYYQASRAVFHTFGLLKSERGKGLAYLLFAEALAAIHREGVSQVVGALVKEGPSHYAHFGPPRRRYAVFSKELS